MTRDHFNQAFNSPYFQSDYYRNETEAGRAEGKILKIINKIFRRTS
jgi:hypothetical protein